MNENNNKEANKRIAKNTLFLYIRLGFVLLISLYTSRVILHNLGVVDYGIYNVVAGFVSMFALLRATLSNATQRFYNYEKGKNGIAGMQKVFISAQYIQIIFVAIIVLLAETVGLWYVVNKMVYPVERASAVLIVYQSAVIALIFVCLQIPYSAAIIAHEKINYYAIVGVIDVVLKLIIAIIIPIIPIDNLSIYGILIAGVSVIDYLLYSSFSKRHFPYLKFSFQFHRETFVNMIKFSGWSSLNGFSQTVKNQGLNILMNYFFGPAINAARGISYQVKGALLDFVMNITTATQPQVVESYAVGNKERAYKLMFTVSKLIFFSLYMVSLPIMIEVSFVLRLWLGNEIPNYTEIFTILVLIITLIDILSTPISMVINASGKVARFNLWNSILGICVLPVAFIFLKQGSDPVMVYIVSLSISIIMLFVSILIMVKETDIKVSQYIHGVLVPLFVVVISTVFLPIIVSHFLNIGFARLITIVSLSILLVCISGYFMGLDANEKELVLSFVKRFAKKIKRQ